MQGKIKFLGKRHFQNNFIIYFILFLFLIGGITIGSILVNKLELTQGNKAIKYLSPLIDNIENGNQASLDMFKSDLLTKLKFTLIVWLSGFVFIGIILIPLIIGLKGISIGFTVGFLVKSFGIKGFTFALSGLLPHYLIILPGILAICFIGLSNANANSKLKRNVIKRINKINLLEYSLLILFSFTIVILGSLVGSFTIPYFIKLLN